MARDILLSENITAGARLLRELEARHEAPETAAWVFFGYRDEWRLVLHSVSSHDRMEFRIELSKIIHASPEIEDGLSLDQVHLGGDAEIIANAIAALLGAGRWDRPRRIGPAMSAGWFIEDALVYRAGYRAVAPVGE